MCLSQLKLQWMLRKHLCPTEWYNGCCFVLTFHLFAMFKHSPKCAHAVQSSSWTWFHSTACICMVCGVRQVLLGKLLTPDTCVAVESGQIRTTKERISYRFAYCTFLTFWAFCTSARFSPFQLCYRKGYHRILKLIWIAFTTTWSAVELATVFDNLLLQNNDAKQNALVHHLSLISYSPSHLSHTSCEIVKYMNTCCSAICMFIN